MIVKYRAIFISLALFFLMISSFFGNILIKSKGLDTQRFAELEVDEIEFGSSYGMMSYLYQLVPINLHSTVTFFLGTIFILCIFRKAYNRYHLALLFFLTILPCMLTISGFQKDLFLVPFIVLAAMILDSNLKDVQKVLLVIAVYSCYAFIFRSYFYFISIVFLILYIFSISNILIRTLIIGLSFFAIFLLPNEIYSMLQSSRDITNYKRLGADQIGNRTAFVNLLPPDSFINFVINYFYAILRLNFGFIFNYSLKDIIFTIFPIIYLYYSFKAILTEYYNSLCGYLILAHFSIYFLFEPDTGSYARHFSVTLPILSIIIYQVWLRKMK